LIEALTNILLVNLVVLPVPTAFSTVYFLGLWRQDRRDAAASGERPTLLAALLALLSTVALLGGTWLGLATFSARFLGRPFPVELLPITLVAIQASLVMVNVSAFAMWRSRVPEDQA